MTLTLIVDTAVVVPVNSYPLTDDTDFKSQETAVAYNAAGMALKWNFVTPAGVQTQTAVTPTTAGVYDWAHLGGGMYSLEIPASGGGSVNNDTEGYGWFTGIATGVLSWAGPILQFSPAQVVNSLVTGSDLLQVDTREVTGTAQTARDLGASVLLSSGTGTGQVKLSAGYVAPNWGDVGNPTTTVVLSGTTIATATTLTNAPSDSVGTTTLLSRLTALRAGYLDNLSAGAVALEASISTVLSKLLKYFQLAFRKDAAIATDNATELTALNASGGSGAGAYANTTEALEALRDRGDAAWTTGTGTSTLDAAGVRAAVGLASANLDTQLDALPTNAELATALAGADDATLAAIAALNDLDSAGAQAAAAAALAAYSAATAAHVATGTSSTATTLQHYVQLLARSDAAIATDNAAALALINANAGSGGGTYQNTTDSQQALRDRGDAAWTSSPDGIFAATAYDAFPFHMVLDSDGVTPATGLTVVASAKIDTGSYAVLDGAVVEQTGGDYYVPISDTDIPNGAQFVTFRFTAATARTLEISMKVSGN